MYTKVLRAEKKDMCQAEDGEILVPNPVILKDMDNDYFVGIQSRRPARFGRVAVVEDSDAESVAVGDQTGILNSCSSDTDVDEERVEEVRAFMDAVSEFEVGDMLGCAFTFEGDEVCFEVFEVDEDTV